MTSSAAWIRTGRGQRSRGLQCEVTRRSCVVTDGCVCVLHQGEGGGRDADVCDPEDG